MLKSQDEVRRSLDDLNNVKIATYQLKQQKEQQLGLSFSIPQRYVYHHVRIYIFMYAFCDHIFIYIPYTYMYTYTSLTMYVYIHSFLIHMNYKK